MTFPQWEKYSLGLGQPSCGHLWERIRKERELCKSTIIECGLRLRRTWKGYVKKDQCSLTALMSECHKILS
jgi:hypothetical protein